MVVRVSVGAGASGRGFRGVREKGGSRHGLMVQVWVPRVRGI